MTWKDDLAQLQGVRDTLRKDGHLMTTWERTQATRLVEELRVRFYPVITAGAVAEMRGSLKGLEAAKAAVVQARQDEAQRWNAGLLAGTMTLIKARVEAVIQNGDNAIAGVTVSGGLREVFEDSLQGDASAQRATCEVFKGLLPLVPEGARLEANALRGESERRLADMRTTEAMVAAGQNVRQAFTAAVAKVNELDRISMTIDGHGVKDVFAKTDLTRAAARLNVDRMTGAVSVLAEDDPRVTGFEEPHFDQLEAVGG